MCYSGGKDSTYTLQLAVQRYGLRVLAFTLDNGYLSPAAFDNIHRVVKNLGVDLITVRPAYKQFEAIVRASALKPIYNPKTLTRISSVCNSCISIVNTTALGIALEKGIPFILAGFTLGQIPANGIVYTNNYRFLQESRLDSLARLRTEAGAFVDDYFCLSERTVGSVTAYPTTVNLLCLEDITESEIVKNIAALGWSSPGELDGCSSNCMLNTFNNYVHQRVYGYNPYELELSHLIRKGLMTREEAIDKVNTLPRNQLESIMAALGIEEEDIERVSKGHG
jgi:hypothetical protein